MKVICAVFMLSSLGLAGCNVVATTTPAVRPQASGSPALEPGLWSYEQEQPCHTATKAPLCGRAIPLFSATIRDLRPILSPGRPIADARTLDHPSAYVISSGDPMLIQVKVVDPTGSGPPVQYMFVALEPTAYDGEKAIAAAKAWPVLCGPPPLEGDPNYGLQDEQGQVTNHPFSGLRMDTFTCAPNDLAAIEGAAKASRLLIGDDDLYLIRWMGAGP